jgi:uncharacterized protein (TIGR03437 family)
MQIAKRESMPNYARIFLCLAASIPADAQVISSIAGTGEQGYFGDGAAAANAWIAMPTGIALDSAGNLYFADIGNRVVRQVNTQGIINTFAGNEMLFLGSNGDGGPATSALLGWSGPGFFGVAMDKAGNLYISDTSSGIARVRKVNSSGIISTYAGGASPISGGDGGQATSAGLGTAAGLAVDSQGNLYIADTVGERIRKVNTAGVITTVAGTGVANYSGDGGPAVNATLSVPVGVAVDSAGNLYITESGNALYGPRVRKVDTSGNISTVAGNGKSGFAGDGGSALNAEFGSLHGIAVDNAGNIYIADYGNYRIRKVDSSGNITTIAGNGKPGGSGVNGNGGLASNSLVQPSGLVVDASGNLYISDFFASQIRKITFGAPAPGLAVSAASLYFAGHAGPLGTTQPQNVTASTTGPSLQFTISATTASGGAWLSTSGTSGSTPGTTQVSANPNPGGTPLPAGTYNGTLTFTPTTPGYSPLQVAVTLVLSTTVPSPAPVITGVVNGASFQANQMIASNTYLTIQGTNLSSATNSWNNSIVGGQLPTSLSGVTVTFSGTPGYISYVSPTQINVLAPTMNGAASVQATNNGALSTGVTIGVAAESPAFFELNNNQVVATRADYTYAAKNGTIPGLTTIPAKPGDVLILWGTGFGATNPVIAPGAVTPSGQTYATAGPVTVTINGVPATVYGVALTPGLAGVYQAAIQVPLSLANGDWPLVATTQDGISSASGVILTVHN